MEEAISRIERHEAVVGVIGLGYVGLPLALVFTEAGFPVRGFDSDPAKIEHLSEGRSYIAHIHGNRVQAAVEEAASPRPATTAGCATATRYWSVCRRLSAVIGSPTSRMSSAPRTRSLPT